MLKNPAIIDDKYDGIAALAASCLGFLMLPSIDDLPGHHAIPVATLWLGIFLFPLIIAPVLTIGTLARVYRAKSLRGLSLLLALLALAICSLNYVFFTFTCARRFDVSLWMPWH